MKHKNIIFGLLLIGLYCILTWPKSPKAEKEKDSDRHVSKAAAEAAVNSRKPERRHIEPPARQIPSSEAEEKLIEEARLEKLKEQSPDAYHYELNNNRLLKEGFGKTPAISQDNPQVRSVKEAIKNGSHPERRSVAIKAPPFDAEKFQNDDQYRRQYMSECVPSRALQGLESGEGVAVTRRTSDYYQEVEQGAEITLSVQTAALFPVTFTSLDLGAFSNGLTSETVLADKEGHASVSFHGVSGTGAKGSIIASSPMASGQAVFQVFTKLKNKEN